MKRFTIAAATAATLIAAPAAFAATFSFDDVTTMQAANGSEVYTSDGKLFGVLTDVDLDGGEATFVIDTANSSNIDSEVVYVVAEEGKVKFADDRLVLQATETELDVGLSGTADPNETARIILTD
ncbi:hypothetical protein [Tateyamaria sp. SN6-1]|uniref:hypothetical protein n=1 Tax=Tateyamaria sp. SN6-1 TaxID=3092148 RepID=UPI0039F5F884